MRSRIPFRRYLWVGGLAEVHTKHSAYRKHSQWSQMQLPSSNTFREKYKICWPLVTQWLRKRQQLEFVHYENDKLTWKPVDGEMVTYTTASQKGHSTGKFCSPKKNSKREYTSATFSKGCSVNAFPHSVISLQKHTIHQPSLPPAQQLCSHILLLPKLTAVKLLLSSVAKNQKFCMFVLNKKGQLWL